MTILLSVLAISSLAVAQNNEKAPAFTAAENAYDFGIIGENDGYAQHSFKFTNTGSAPLVINRVTASCGCTQPEWPQTPIEPGKEGFINITFNPRGRLGPFNKIATVYTNEDDGYKRYNLTIKGTVVEKPSDPGVAFTDTIGGLGVEKKKLEFKAFNSTTINRLATYIKNYNTETVYLTWENIPDYITINAPDSLKADWPGEIIFAVDGTKTAEKRGRITNYCTWIVKNKEGQLLGSEPFTLTVNHIDDFKQLSPLQMVSAPALEIKSTYLDFGAVKKGALGLFNNTVNKPLTLTNTGKSDLIIHSLTGDEKRLYLPDIKGKTIKAGESFTVNASIKTKEFHAENLDTEIYIVCNDPKGPFRRIKVIAEKIN